MTRSGRRTLALAPIVGLVAFWLQTTVAYATTITVNDTGAAVSPTDGLCTLVEALTAAGSNAPSGGVAGECAAGQPDGTATDVVVLQASQTYTLSAVHSATEGPNGLPAVTSAITVQGNGATIERSAAGGTPELRIFFVAPSGNLRLEGLTLSNGSVRSADGVTSACNGGGAIRANGATLTLVGTTVRGSRVRNQVGGLAPVCTGGGGINALDSVVSISDSVIMENTSEVSGGGIYADGGSLTIVRSTIANNRAEATGYDSRGGGIYADADTAVTIDRSALTGNVAQDTGGLLSFSTSASIVNSTVSGNRATSLIANFSLGQRGRTVGGIRAGDEGFGSMTLVNVTVTANTADDPDTTVPSTGGVLNGGTLTLLNTVVAGNSVGGSATGSTADCRESSPITSQGNNLFRQGTGCPTGNATDRILAPAVPITTVLGPLANNGGPTQTHALPEDSPAIDRGLAAACAASPVNGIDQRGTVRPFGPRCDIGAYEGGITHDADLSLTLLASATRPAFGSNVTLTATVRNDGPDPASGVTARVTLPAGLTFVLATPAGAYQQATGAWTVGSLGVGATSVLQVVAKVDSRLPLTVTAEVMSSGQPDADSTPGNGVTIEDDFAQARIAALGLNVNTTAMVSDANDGLCTLIEAIVAANADTPSGPAVGECVPEGTPGPPDTPDTIYLQPTTTYTLTAVNNADPGPNIEANGLPLIVSTVTVEGAGSTVQRAGGGTPAFRLFWVALGSALTLNDLTVRGGSVTGGSFCGGGLVNEGSLTLNRAVVRDNAVQSPFSGRGGEMCNRGTLALVDSTVTANTIVADGIGDGGGIYSFETTGGRLGIVSLVRTTVSGNQLAAGFQATGGGLYVHGGRLTSADSQIVGNRLTAAASATALGGGLLADGSTVNLTRTRIGGNAVTSLGGNPNRVLDGGGIAIRPSFNAPNGPPSIVTLIDGTVGGDTPADGNVAPGAGGGIVVSGEINRLTITGGSVRNNVASASWEFAGGGGGIANGASTNGGTVSLTNVQMSGNRATAGDGGAIFNRGMLTVNSGVITANRALSGGAVGNGTGPATGGTVALTNVTISANQAEVLGGGISSQDGSVTVSGGAIRDNGPPPGLTAPRGGGIYSRASLILEDGLSIHNNVGLSGGGIAVHGPTTIRTGTTISANQVTAVGMDGDKGGGGVVAGGSASLSVSETTIRDNQALVSVGGGVRLLGGAMAGIRRSTVADNRASEAGGLHMSTIAGTGSALSLVDNTISGNIGTAFHGAVLMQTGSALFMLNSTASGNSAGISGGTIAIGGHLTMLHSTITNNVGDGAIHATGLVTVAGTVVAGNRNIAGTPLDCVAASASLISSQGNNLVGQGTGCSFAATGDQTVAPADVFTRVLGPLGSNGGPTPTHSLIGTGPAVDAGNPATFGPSNRYGCPATDQRGATRPQGRRCDVGAVESNATSVLRCDPRPSMAILTTPNGAGEVRVTVSVQTNAALPTNALTSLVFTGLDNASVQIGGTPVTVGGPVAEPPGATSFQFVVRRTTGGAASTAHFTATDACGEWKSFVGGGPAAF